MLAPLVNRVIVGRVGFQVDFLLQIQIGSSTVDPSFHHDGAIRDAAVLLVVAVSPHGVVAGQLSPVMRDAVSLEVVTAPRGIVGCHGP
jgi:Na+-transporting NADH:ubiquinone oxidoreductase subunit NqrB